MHSYCVIDMSKIWVESKGEQHCWLMDECSPVELWSQHSVVWLFGQLDAADPSR